jgi:hypothetical protein
VGIVNVVLQTAGEARIARKTCLANPFASLSAGISDNSRTVREALSTWLRIETRTPSRRHDWAQIILTAEHAVADPRDEIVHHVAQRARDQTQNIGQGSPSAAQPPHDVERGIRAREQRSTAGEDNEGVGQAGALLWRQERLYCFALQRREPEGSS